MKRRGFIKKIGLGSTVMGLSGGISMSALAAEKKGTDFQYGLCTALWDV